MNNASLLLVAFCFVWALRFLVYTYQLFHLRIQRYTVVHLVQCVKWRMTQAIGQQQQQQHREEKRM